MEARIVKQLSIFIENRPGMLAAVCRRVADAGINLKAISVSEAIDHAVVRMIMSDVSKAREVLATEGVIALENEVMEVALDDRPGALAALTEKLVSAGINLEYAYGSSPADPAQGLIIIRADKPDAALKTALEL